MNSAITKKGVCLKTDPFRTIQIHPTRRCNLACLHCYSSSAPHLKTELDIEALKKFLLCAYKNGFNNISVSGGEPFLYSKLEELLKFSKSLGFQNTLVSNGMLLLSEKNKKILDYIDLIAISIDGPKHIHDHIRGQVGAFEKMLKGVSYLKKTNKPFGFIHTVTPKSWKSLLWLGEFAKEQGAKLLQLHPLEMYGRATEKLNQLTIDDTLAHQIFILANYLRSKYSNTMVVQLDLLHRDYIEAFPQSVNTFARDCSKNNTLSDVFDTIIIEETGRILPFAYGFSPSLAIGNIYDFTTSIFTDYITENRKQIKRLYSKTYAEIIENKALDIVNWNEIFISNSKTMKKVLNTV